MILGRNERKEGVPKSRGRGSGRGEAWLRHSKRELRGGRWQVRDGRRGRSRRHSEIILEGRSSWGEGKVEEMGGFI